MLNTNINIRKCVARGLAGSTAVVLALAAAAPMAWAQAPDASVDPAAADEDQPAIVVTARNRDERLQDVPIPISVLSSDVISAQRVFNVSDLAQRAPGLTATTPNARRTGVSLRGIGKTSGNDNMEAAVGVIVDDVFLDHVGMTYQDFTDLEQIEILRGPQGTLLGKNTSLGVLKYTSKSPSFEREGSAEIEGGLSTPAFKARGSFSDALIADKLAFRASFSIDKQHGDIFNVNSAIGGRWHERDRWAGRFQLLLRATDDLTFKLNVDGAETHENSNTKPFMIDPTVLNDGSARTTTYTTRLARGYFGGYAPIIGSWTTIDIDQALPLITRNYGASLVTTWDIGAIELKSITAARKFHFDANNDNEQTRFTIGRGGTLVDTEQYSEELRASGNITPELDYQAGLYFFKITTDTNSRNLFGKDAGAFYATNAQYAALSATPALLQQALNNTLSVTNQHPISTSQAAFAQLNWKATDTFTITTGIRYTREQKTSTTQRSLSFADGSPLVSTGDATADAIRLAQLSTPYATVTGTPIHAGAVAWLINPSYHLSPDVMIYASASGGGKSGAVAFDNTGTRRNVKPEKTTDFELGLKGRFFDVLWLNANLYYTKVRDYQATTSIANSTSSTGYSSVLGNIPSLRAQGIEIDGTLQLTRGFTITFGGTYNDAEYIDWSTATCPRSYPTTVVVCNNTGKQIVGAPKWTAILGFDFKQEIGSSGVTLHAFANDSYKSSHNLEQLLSPYGWQKAYHLTDAGIGIITKIAGVETEVSVVAKNLFDEQYTTSVNDFSNNAPVGYDGIGQRRYVGAILRAKF